jgi:hypothetical protein
MCSDWSKFKKISCWKPLGQLNCDFAGMIIMWSCTKLVNRLSHVGFPISAKNNNPVYDHPMNISAKFGSNLFRGFRKKDENVKFP